MADECLRKPKRKPNAGIHVLESPFPIPIQAITGKSANNLRWYYYFGSIQSDHVAVYKIGDITFLYRWGFFGKGILSKSHPQYERYNELHSEYTRKRYSYKRPSGVPEEQEANKKVSKKIQNEMFHYSMSSSVPDYQDVVQQGSTTMMDVLPQCRDLQVYADDSNYGSFATDGGQEEDMEVVAQVKNEMDGVTRIFSVDELKRPYSSQLESSDNIQKLNKYHQIFEHTQLTYEEAFFLSYGLGCLSIKNDKHTLSLTEMWRLCSARKKNFIPLYIAYHHFRSKGWVVRCGNLYGADFLLYQDGMPFYHASYSVFVCMKESTLLPLDESYKSWKDISAVCRVNEKVAKEVLFCYVEQLDELDCKDISLPNCIKHFTVMEVVMRRWIPEKHREAK